jgi:hypothetical protein
MALELYIHPCVHNPPHRLHCPQADKPLRIRIQGPLESIQKILPTVSWHKIGPFPQPGGLELARLTHQKLYRQEELLQQACSSTFGNSWLARLRLIGTSILNLVLKYLYGIEKTEYTLTVRDEYLAWVMEGRRPLE